MLQALRIAAAITVIVTLAGSAHADDKARAREAYRLGTQHYDLGEYDQALEQFKQAYRAYEDPAFLFNIAQCHRLLGHDREALQFYRTYLRKAPDAPYRAEVEKRIDELDKAIAAEQAPPPTTHAAPAAPPPVAAPTTPAPAATTTAAPVAATTPSPTTLATSAPPPEKPRHRRAWIWGVVAGVAVAGLAVGLGVGLGTQSHAPQASYGTVTF